MSTVFALVCIGCGEVGPSIKRAAGGVRIGEETGAFLIKHEWCSWGQRGGMAVLRDESGPDALQMVMLNLAECLER